MPRLFGNALQILSSWKTCHLNLLLWTIQVILADNNLCLAMSLLTMTDSLFQNSLGDHYLQSNWFMLQIGVVIFGRFSHSYMMAVVITLFAIVLWGYFLPTRKIGCHNNPFLYYNNWGSVCQYEFGRMSPLPLLWKSFGALAVLNAWEDQCGLIVVEHDFMVSSRQPLDLVLMFNQAKVTVRYVHRGDFVYNQQEQKIIHARRYQISCAWLVLTIFALVLWTSETNLVY